MRKSKGFLGPIGDDLPSLIPLLFALLIFFYVFTFTWTIFDQSSKEFDDSVDILAISNTMKGGSYLRGLSHFQEQCREAQGNRRVKFMAGLLPLSTGPGQEFKPVDIESLEQNFFGEGQEKFFCHNVGESNERPTVESRNRQIRSFPIALEFQNPDTGSFYVRPMLLVVVTWG